MFDGNGHEIDHRFKSRRNAMLNQRKALIDILKDVTIHRHT